MLIDAWCKENDWTDPQEVQVGGRSTWYAFPPYAVVPVPVPIPGNVPLVDSARMLELQEGLIAAFSRVSVAVESIVSGIALSSERIRGFAEQESDRIEKSFRQSLMQSVQERSIAISNLCAAFEIEDSISAIAHLEEFYQMRRPLAQIRLREFCDRHSLTEDAVAKMLRSGQVIVRHGVLCQGKKFPKLGQNWKESKR